MAISGPEIAGSTVVVAASAETASPSERNNALPDPALTPGRAAAIAEETAADAGGSLADGQSDSDEPLASAAAALEALVGGFTEGGELEIVLDEETDRFIYQSVDPASGEVLRQFPPEEILQAVRTIRDLEGLIVDETA